MKKTSALFLSFLFLCLLSLPALAAGKMTVTQENCHIINSYRIYGYTFAKVENTGDKPVEFSAGLLELYDSNGDSLTSTDYIYCYPDCLAPDEIGYVYSYDQVEQANSYADIDDYMLTVTGKSTSSSVTRYPATGSYQQDVQVSKYSTYNYVAAEITNNSEDTLYNVNVVIALLDENDNILYLCHNDFYNSTGITPGSTITYRDSISDSWYEAWEREGVTPSRVDVIAYVENPNY